MPKIETLTPQQEANIIPHRDFWLNYILSCKNRTDREKAKKGVEWLYKFCGKKPPVIIWMDSPFGCQVAANVFEGLLKSEPDNIWANIEANKKLKYYQIGYRGGVYDYGWVAWIDYFLQNDLIKTDKKKDFDCLKELLLSGVFDMIQLDGLCFVSDMPTKIVRNEGGRLHNTDGMAVEFKDGFGQHYINGRFLAAEHYNKISTETFTLEDFTKEANEEIKSTCIAFMQEKYGDEYLFRFFSKDLKEVDTYTDKKDEKYLQGTTGGMNVGVYTLFKGKINNEPVAYVRCYCPSTDRMFFLGVAPENKNAKDAIASLYRIPSKLKPHIKSIARQGERFSTTFTPAGTKIMKSLTERDTADLVSISGKDYFELMSYEY